MEKGTSLDRHGRCGFKCMMLEMCFSVLLK